MLGLGCLGCGCNGYVLICMGEAGVYMRGWMWRCVFLKSILGRCAYLLTRCAGFVGCHVYT